MTEMNETRVNSGTKKELREARDKAKSNIRRMGHWFMGCLFGALAILSIAAFFLADQINLIAINSPDATGSDKAIFLFAILGPCLFILLYYFIKKGDLPTDDTNTSDTVKEIFAESLYYMGFIITLLALVVMNLSLVFVNTGTDVLFNYETVVLQSGTALISTIVGLSLRIYFSHFTLRSEDRDQPDAHEMYGALDDLHYGIKSLNDELPREMGRIIKQSDSSISATTEAVVRTMNKYVRTIKQQIQRIESRLGDMESTLSERINGKDPSPDEE